MGLHTAFLHTSLLSLTRSHLESRHVPSETLTIPPKKGIWNGSRGTLRTGTASRGSLGGSRGCSAPIAQITSWTRFLLGWRQGIQNCQRTITRRTTSPWPSTTGYGIGAPRLRLPLPLTLPATKCAWLSFPLACPCALLPLPFFSKSSLPPTLFLSCVQLCSGINAEYIIIVDPDCIFLRSLVTPRHEGGVQVVTQTPSWQGHLRIIGLEAMPDCVHNMFGP